MAHAIEALTPLRRDIADAISNASSPEAARKAVSKVRKQYGNSNEIADALMVPMVMGDLAGQLMVHEHEVQPLADGPRLMALGDAQPLDAFLNLPWDEALDYFRERGVLDQDELDALVRGHAEATMQARRDTLDRVQARVYELLDQAIERGETMREFGAALSEDAAGLGITNQDPAYLNMVFRTNVLDAYGAGRLTAMNDPDVVEARPYRQIRTAGDGRVRDEHVPLEGLTFAASGPLKSLRPPFDYQCRCAIVSLAEYDGPVADSLPPGAVAPGFGGL